MTKPRPPLPWPLGVLAWVAIIAVIVGIMLLLNPHGGGVPCGWDGCGPN